jgi:hypothetical protein
MLGRRRSRFCGVVVLGATAELLKRVPEADRPSIARIRIIDDTMERLYKDHWASIDKFYLAGNSANISYLNWHNPGVETLTPVNAPAFVADAGWTGDGATSYLTAGATVAAPYTLNSAHLGVWVNTNLQDAGGDIGFLSNSNARILSRNLSDAIGYRLNNSTSGSVTGITDSRGHTLLNRTGNTSGDVYKNGADVGNFSTNVAASIPTTAFVLCRHDTTYSSKQIFAGHCGGALTAGAVADIYDIINEYKTAIAA